MSERTGNLDDHFGSVCFFATWILPIRRTTVSPLLAVAGTGHSHALDRKKSKAWE
jgi:hypothetical protein